MTKVKKPSGEVLEYIKENYFYNEENGTIDGKYNKDIGWMEKGQSRVFWKISVKGRKIRRSHLVWFLCKEEWPISQLDHKDRDSLNDDIFNLREVDNVIQQQNKDNYGGYRGFSIQRAYESNKIRYRRFRVVNQSRGIQLGYHYTREEAIASIDEYWKQRGMLGVSWNFDLE